MISVSQVIPQASASCRVFSRPEFSLLEPVDNDKDAKIVFAEAIKHAGEDHFVLRRKLAKAWVRLKKRAIIRECLGGGACEYKKIEEAVTQAYQAAAGTIGKVSILVAIGGLVASPVLLASIFIDGVEPVSVLTIGFGITAGLIVAPVAQRWGSKLFTKLLHIENGGDNGHDHHLGERLDKVWFDGHTRYGQLRFHGLDRVRGLMDMLLGSMPLVERAAHDKDVDRLVVALAEMFINARQFYREIPVDIFALEETFAQILKQLELPKVFKDLVLKRIRLHRLYEEDGEVYYEGIVNHFIPDV